MSACLKEPRSHTGQEQPLKCCCGAAARLCGAASSSLSQAQGGVLGEEQQAAIREGMLGGAGRGTALPVTSPQKTAAMWEEAKGKEPLASPVLQQFLRASLATMEDEAWTKGLSCELSRWLSSSPSNSGEKVGSPQLYPAVQSQGPN